MRAYGRKGTEGSKAVRLVLLVSAVAPAPWRAAAEATTIVSLDGVGRVGPAGVMLSAGVARRWLQDDGPSSFAQGRYFQLGLTAGTNPAYAQGSLAAEWVPLAPLQLRLQYDAFSFFGTNGSLLRVPSAGSKFGEAEIDSLSGREESGLGQRVMLNPVLRARFGRVVLRNESEVSWYRMSSRTGWYYEWEHDTLLGESDWLVANRTTAFVELWRGAGEATLLIGPTYDVTRAGQSDITRHRVGAAAYFEPAGRWLGFDRVRFFAMAGANVVDRNRQGEPFAIFGLGGDIQFDRAARP
jgi:hypothetical protein